MQVPAWHGVCMVQRTSLDVSLCLLSFLRQNLLFVASHGTLAGQGASRNSPVSVKAKRRKQTEHQLHFDLLADKGQCDQLPLLHAARINGNLSHF